MKSFSLRDGCFAVASQLIAPLRGWKNLFYARGSYGEELSIEIEEEKIDAGISGFLPKLDYFSGRFYCFFNHCNGSNDDSFHIGGRRYWPCRLDRTVDGPLGWSAPSALRRKIRESRMKNCALSNRLGPSHRHLEPSGFAFINDKFNNFVFSRVNKEKLMFTTIVFTQCDGSDVRVWSQLCRVVRNLTGLCSPCPIARIRHIRQVHGAVAFNSMKKELSGTWLESQINGIKRFVVVGNWCLNGSVNRGFLKVSEEFKKHGELIQSKFNERFGFHGLLLGVVENCVETLFSHTSEKASLSF